MKPTLIREIETLKRWSAQAEARKCQALNFYDYKPLIKPLPAPIGGWICQGPHPEGMISYGWGPTPEAAYESWTYNGIPF
jgi:hypothetical protein